MSNKALDPHFWSLETVFKAVYIVPVYQRPYSWDEEQVITLIDDIFEAYSSPERQEGYFTGNIIVHDKNDKINGIINRFEIIDGQQRITTFSLILLALYSLALKRGCNNNDKTLLTTKELLWKYVERKYVKEYRVVNLNSIEKKCFSDLFDYCFDDNNVINSFSYSLKYDCKSKFDNRVMSNYRYIYSLLSEKIKEDDHSILDFIDYILQYIQFIVIESSCKQNKVFSMFESINSKGKRLEEIDLIKTYIFSNLEEQYYDEYLDKWGQLIIKTQDNLYDYLYNYIKAYLCFYRQNITIINFKAICKKEILYHFKENSIDKALRKLLDDLCDKVEYYNMLNSCTETYNLVQSKKMKFYYRIFTDISYKHPKALFFRLFVEFSEGKIIKNDVIEIVVETIKFMIKFLTIGHRDSKDAITMFSNIMNEVYVLNYIDKESVIGILVSELYKQGITDEKLKNDLQTLDSFDQNKKLTVALLSLYESAEQLENKYKISYDQAYVLLNSFSESFSLDHLLVQSPNQESVEFKYYCDSNNRLVLKQGNDFPNDIVVDGMDYDLFKHVILNRLGNLRIYYRDKNSGRQNTAIELKEYSNFTKYKDIIERGINIINVLFDSALALPNIDISNSQLVSLKKAEANLPKMDKLLEYGIVKKGAELYIISHPETSKATLIDEKYVIYNDKKMTLNEWGCLVTGWKSIRIYAYAAIVGEIETLHEKRMEYYQNHNEEITGENQ